MNDSGLSQVLGTTRSWKFTIKDASRNVVTTFLSTDLLSAAVWGGDDLVTIFSPDIAWIEPTEGTVQLTITSAALATALVTPGVYRIQVTVSPQTDGQPRSIYDGTLKLIATPGTAVSLPVYCTKDELEVYAPQVSKLQDADVDQIGFAQQRAEARQWFEMRVLARYRPQPGRARKLVGESVAVAGPYSRPADGTAPTPAVIKGYFASNFLMITREVVAANAHRAAALVYLAAPGRDNVYQQLGMQHKEMAEDALKKAVIEFDTNSNGVSDIRIDRDVTFLT